MGENLQRSTFKAEAKRRYLEGENTRQLGRSFGVSAETVRVWLAESFVPRRSRSERFKRYEYRHDAFDSPTPEAAYWAGLLMADGNVNEKDGLLQMALLKKDESLVNGLAKYLQFTGPLPEYTKVYKSGKVGVFKAVRLVAHDLIVALKQWGVVPRKTHVGRVGEVVREKGLEEFYFRGLFEGDGCVHRRPDHRVYLSLCGNPSVVDSFRDWCWREVREVGSLNRRNPLTYVVQFGSKPAKLVGSRLYLSALVPRLTRKEELLG